MKSTGRSSTKQSKHKLIYFLIISTFLGLLSSSYLLINLITGLGQTCNPLQACYLNTESYSTIFTSKIMVFPTLYFLTTLLLILYFFTTSNKLVGKILYYFAECSLLVVALFVYMQLYRSQGLCPICIIVTASAAVVFLASLFLPKHFRQL